MKNLSRSIAIFLTLMLVLTTPGFAATWSVDTNDFSGALTACDDLTPADCSLSGAIDNHNASFGGGNTINVATGVGELVVEPYIGLDITQSDLTILSDPAASDRIVLDGPASLPFDAITIDTAASNVSIVGLVIYSGFDNGIVVSGDNATIAGNYIGLAADGLSVGPNSANGIKVLGTASGTTINGGNIISANGENGIWVNDVDDITIASNYIGTANDTSIDRGNTLDGIHFNGDLNAGTVTINGNTISGNGSDGIEFGTGGSYDDGATVWIYGNRIGTDTDTAAAVPNDQHGIYAPQTTSDIDFTIGGNYDGTSPSTEGNTISGNGQMGVKIESGDSVRLAGNAIGVNSLGTVPVPNGSDGVYLDAGSALDSNTDILVGSDNDAGDDNFECNIISANGGYGINISGTEATDVYIACNSIGGGFGGTYVMALGNTKDGIYINNTATNIQLGVQSLDGDNPEYTRNWLISNGGGINVDEVGGGATVKVQNNYLGIDSASNAAGNVYDSGDTGTDPDGSGSGFMISNANDLSYLYIGKDNVSNDSGEANFIGNNLNGIEIGDANLGVVFIMGNYIGTNDGAGDHGNTITGISVNDTLDIDDLNIGGSDSTDDVVFDGSSFANTISANVAYAIHVVDLGPDSPAADVTISRNYIGSSNTGFDSNIGNGSGGIYILDGDLVNILDNTIIDNTGDGVSIVSDTVANAVFQGNFIGMQSYVVSPSGNTGNGIYIDASAMTEVTIGGDASDGEGNIITANGGDGIRIDTLASNTSTATIEGNFIGFCVDTGTGAGMSTPSCGNAGDGIDVRQGALTVGSGHALGATGLGGIGRGNYIGNNSNYGIAVSSNVASFMAVGNIIGVYRSGVSSAPDTDGGNILDGININSGVTSSVTVGSAFSAAMGNVISGNGQHGLSIEAVATSATVNVYNSSFGTNYLKSAAIANTMHGINLTDGTGDIGGTSASQGNLISGNAGEGVYIGGAAEGYDLFANTIGLDGDKNLAIPNGSNGVLIESATEASTFNIGNSTSGSTNYISGNGGNGIYVSAPTTAMTVNILKNYIGLDGDGDTDLGNVYDGVYLQNALATVVLGDTTTPADGRNYISGNGTYGVNIETGTVTLKGNYIGLAVDGSTVIDNDSGSVYINSTDAVVTIGGSPDTISNNGNVGINTNIAITNESTVFSADNVFTDLIGPFVASVSCSTSSCAPYYRRDTAAILPNGCGDGYDNDGDSAIDTADNDCTTGSTENDANSQAVAATSSGGGGSGSILNLSPVQPSTDTVVDEFLDDLQDTLTVEDVVDTVEDEVEIPAVTEPIVETRELLPTAEVERKLEKALGTNTDLLLGTRRVEIETSLSDLIDAELSQEDNSDSLDSELNKERSETMEEALKALSEGGDGAAVEAVEEAIADELGTLIENAISRGEGGLTLKVDGGKKTFKKKPVIKFASNALEAKNANNKADQSGSNELVVAPDDDLLGTGVSVAAEMRLLGTVLDSKANEKLWFGTESAPKVPRIALPGHKDAVFGPKRSFVIVGPAGAKGKAYVLDPDVAADYFDKYNGECSEEYCFEAGEFEVSESSRTEIKIDFNEVLKLFNQSLETGDTQYKYYILLVSDEGSSLVEVNIDFALDERGVTKSQSVSGVELNHEDANVSLSGTMYSAVMLANLDVSDEQALADEPIILSGIAEPNAIIFVSWKSITKNSVVIADASQGYFEVEAPIGLEAGDHELVFYAYNPEEGFAANFSNIFFKKVF
ncbi:right-handed parallel beta-helix repeat-containing protein [Candidatus Peregrinibacteria bacterium]|nr:right-handed parallel beta-helix repeat-containing protein [Candidatus Peregrinibacteria bacterium]